MTKTIEVARDRADRPRDIVLPTEVARGVYIHNPPGAEALKLLLMMIKKSGAGIGSSDDRQTMLLADVRREPGMRHHTQQTVRDLLVDVATTAVQFEDDLDGEPVELIGSMVSHMFVKAGPGLTGDLLIIWHWGHAFARTAELSRQWALVDKSTALAMRSRYAISLFIHVSSLFRKTRATHQEFDVAHLRKVLGVPEGRHSEFRHLKRKAIAPAVAEINRTSPHYELAATYHKTGRTVTSVTIQWTEKPLAQKTEARAELDRHSAGRQHRQAGTAERIADPPAPPFPTSIHTFRGSDWEKVYYDSGCRADKDATRLGFIEWTARTGKPQTLQMFYNFCKGENERKGIP